MNTIVNKDNNLNSLNRIKWIIDKDKKDWTDIENIESQCKDGICKI